MKIAKKILLSMLIAIFIILTGLIVHTPSNEKYRLDRSLYKQVSHMEGYVKINDVSPEFLAVLVANEDRRFYDHFGFDIVRIGGAIIGNLRAGELETGGSTITQQLAKNLFYTREQTLERKLLELGTAIRLEIYFSKSQILEMYINVIYYGSDAYGIKQASKTYFNKSAEQLTLDESGVLVGLLPAPSVYNPNANPDISRRRKKEVLTIYQTQLGGER